MKTNFIYIICLLIGISACTDDFLTRPPLDKIEDAPEYWNNENNIRNTFYDIYPNYFIGYGRGWEKTDFYDGTEVSEWTDDLAQMSVTYFRKNVPATAEDAGWSFEYVRRINHIVENVQNSNLPEDIKNHWVGVARFFRGMEYSKQVRRFGDVPWFDKVISETDMEKLYKPRDSRTMVMDNVALDLQFASENVRIIDGFGGLNVNRYVVNAFMSRIFLFEGSWQKYHSQNQELSVKYLQLARKAANEIIASNKYSISNDYKALTTSLDLKGNPEIILFRAYALGVLGHSEMSFQNEQIEVNSPSKDLIDSYVSSNGLPINQLDNKLFKGDKWLIDELENRDPRLLYVIDPYTLHLNGVVGLYAISGYFGNKFVNESLRNNPQGMNEFNATDAPIMRYAEVLLNYVEASAELSLSGGVPLTQDDLDKSINLIRARQGVDLPALQLGGMDLKVNGIVINDPARDADVPSLLWEIRRERRIELAYEGLRFDDLRRWKKLNYSDMSLNKKLNLGAWLDKPKFVAWHNANSEDKITIEALKSITLDREGNVGYIKPISTSNIRTHSQRDYLYPLPVDQIKLYKDQGKELTQNPGW